MNENAPGQTQTLSVPAGPPPSSAPPGPAGQFAPPPAAPRPAKTRWRDVIFGWRAAIAVFAAGIIIGGLVGAAITLIVDHHGNNGPTISRLPGGGFGGRGFGQYGGPGAGGTGGQTGQSDGQAQGPTGQSDGQADGFLGQPS